MKVNDVVIPKDPLYPFVSGCGYYTHAIIASMDPFVIISERGDMLWRATVTPDSVIALCQAHPDIVQVVQERLYISP
jgi:hypothetical protein